MLNLYDVVFYCGDGLVPAYYIVGHIEAESAAVALQADLRQTCEDARKLLGVVREVTDEELRETLYLLRGDDLVPLRKVE